MHVFICLHFQIFQQLSCSLLNYFVSSIKSYQFFEACFSFWSLGSFQFIPQRTFLNSNICIFNSLNKHELSFVLNYKWFN